MAGRNWGRDGQIAGATGEALGIEAIRVRLVLKIANSISVSLNKTTDVLVVGSTDTLSGTVTPIDAINKDVVWTSSDSNIATVDTTGKVTAISVGTATIIATIVDGSKIATCEVHVNKEIISGVSVTYQGYVQGIGWQNPVSDGQEAGTDGLNSRLDAIKIKLTDTLPGASIRYQTNVEGIGWQNSVKDDALEGTIGLNKRLEAIKINLENMSGYSVQYQIYIQNIGWQDWVSDGQIAGTTGEPLRIEAIKIRIVKN